MSDIALILGLGIFYPLVHLANGWLFAFAEVAPHVSLIYLPAFLRLMNVLVLGKLKGSVATILGGMLLLSTGTERTIMDMVQVACSAGGPLVALWTFEYWRKRRVILTSLPDLAALTLIYCLANALLHHFAWALLAPQNLGTPSQIAFMVLGDLTGALMGAYILKWVAQRLGITSP